MSADQASPKSPRPSIVTLSCVFIAVTAFLTLTELVTALMDWGTVDMQKAIAPALRQLQANGVDVAMTGLLRILHGVALAMVLFVVSMMVFAIYALRGDRVSRVFASVFAAIAGMMSLPAGTFGVLQAAMLLLAAGALWSTDARRWYAGEAPPSAPALSPATASAASTGLPPPPVPVRPASVLTASLVTILGSLAAGAFATIYLVVYTFARRAYMEAINSGPFGDMVKPDDVQLMMQVMLWASVMILPIALAGVLGAAALLARRRIGRTATLAWAWATAIIGLMLLPIGLLATAGAGWVIALLRRDDARAWTP